MRRYHNKFFKFRGSLNQYYFLLRTKNDFLNKKFVSIKNVRIFKIKSKRHGIPVTFPCLTEILNMEHNQLKSCYDDYKNTEVNNIWFSYKISGLIPNVKFAYKLVQNKIKKQKVGNA